MAFPSNYRELLSAFKKNIALKFDVKLFGERKTFIGWEIRHGASGISFCQQRYVGELLEKNGMNCCNSTTFTAIGNDADMNPAQDIEALLSYIDHLLYRRKVGER